MLSVGVERDQWHKMIWFFKWVNSIPANIYMFKVAKEAVEKGVKNVQSSQ